MRYYLPDFEIGRSAPLPPDEAHHFTRVMRGKSGDDVIVFDGRGREASAQVEVVQGRQAIVRVTAARQPVPEPSVSITLAQALLKSDSMDRVVRDAVMMGVAAVQPLITARIDVPKAALRGDGRQEHLERTVISSVKQCGRAVLPPVLAAATLASFLQAEREELCLMFVEPAAVAPAALTDLKALENKVPVKAAILIGPEGGWDAAEIAAAQSAGATLVTLGGRTFRADTAATIAMAVLQYAWKDF